MSNFLDKDFFMRIYGAIQTSFWESSDIQQLSDEAKLLAIYLLTGPHSNMLGCLRLPDGYIMEDLKWNNVAIQNAFNQLTEIDFLTRDTQTAWLIIHQFLRWNRIQNPRQGIGIQKLFDIVPEKSNVFKPLVNSLLTNKKYLTEGFVNHLQTLNQSFDTVSKDCLTDKEQEQEQNQEQKKIFISTGDIDNTSFAEKSISKESALKPKAIEVLQFLNEKTGKAYRPVDANLKLIIARLKSGASISDCYKVIAKKTREWKSDAKMAEYLRPATLFNAIKFEQYIGELVVQQVSGGFE